MLLTVDPAAPGAHDLAAALERGDLVYFERAPVALPSPEDAEFLRTALAPRMKRKNVSYYPDARKLVGFEADAAERERCARILREHSERVRAFLQGAIPRLTPGWRVGTCSFRPLQEKGRALSAHASNELVHVDAGAYGATHGDRILRFFVNLNPSEDRVWLTKGPFRELYRKHARAAGIDRPLEDNVALKAWSGAVRAASRALPMLRMIDSSPYDRLMRRFHNYMKDDPAFRDGKDGLEQLSFKPFSSWMVLTDTLSHACIEGQHALVDTFLVPLANCALPEHSPWHILAGRA